MPATRQSLIIPKLVRAVMSNGFVISADSKRNWALPAKLNAKALGLLFSTLHLEKRASDSPRMSTTIESLWLENLTSSATTVPCSSLRSAGHVTASTVPPTRNTAASRRTITATVWRADT
jgi:hypothetical protein